MQICCHGNMLALSRGFGAKLLTPAVSQAERHTHTLSPRHSLSLSLSLPLLSHTHAHARTDAPAHMGAHHVMMILRTLELWRRGVGQSFLVFPPPPGATYVLLFLCFLCFFWLLPLHPSADQAIIALSRGISAMHFRKEQWLPKGKLFLQYFYVKEECVCVCNARFRGK